MLSHYVEDENNDEKDEGEDDNNNDKNDDDDDEEEEKADWMNTDIKPPEMELIDMEMKTYLYVQYRTTASIYVDVKKMKNKRMMGGGISMQKSIKKKLKNDVNKKKK